MFKKHPSLHQTVYKKALYTVYLTGFTVHFTVYTRYYKLYPVYNMLCLVLCKLHIV